MADCWMLWRACLHSSSNWLPSSARFSHLVQKQTIQFGVKFQSQYACRKPLWSHVQYSTFNVLALMLRNPIDLSLQHPETLVNVGV